VNICNIWQFHYLVVLTKRCKGHRSGWHDVGRQLIRRQLCLL